MTLRATMLLLGLLLLLPGCAVFTLDRNERETLEQLEQFGFRRTEAGTIPPATVGLANAWGPIGILFGPDLGVVPLGGAGNFFLASRVADGSGQFWLGVLNTITWPISPLWSVPQVVADTDIVNQKETAFHFTRSVRGARQMSIWRTRATMARPPVMPGDPTYPDSTVPDPVVPDAAEDAAPDPAPADVAADPKKQ